MLGSEHKIIKPTPHNMTYYVWQKWMHNRYTLMAPNVYVSWHNEMDIFGLRKSGFCDEFEIKTSVSDFNADFKKRTTVECAEYLQEYEYVPCAHPCCSRCGGTDIRDDGTQCGYQAPPRLCKTKNVSKHEALQEGLDIPNYFSFLIPEELESKIEVPDHAGLYAFRPTSYLGKIYEIKKPPRLHNRRLSPHLINKIAMKMASRYWDYKSVQMCTQRDSQCVHSVHRKPLVI